MARSIRSRGFFFARHPFDEVMVAYRPRRTGSAARNGGLPGYDQRTRAERRES